MAKKEEWKNEILGYERLRAFVKEDVKKLIDVEKKQNQEAMRKITDYRADISTEREDHLSREIKFLENRYDKVSKSMPYAKEILEAYDEGIKALKELRKEIMRIKP